MEEDLVLEERGEEPRRPFLVKLIRKRIPILRWLPQYRRKYLVDDAIAGVTVALTIIPQSMAYSGLAGLPPQYGLYSSYIGCFIYIFLGSCPQVAVGPASLLGLLVYQTCGYDFPQCTVWISLWSGIFQLLMAALNLGVIMKFISDPVTVGFTAGAAITTISSQIKYLFGMTVPRAEGIVAIWRELIKHRKTFDLEDAVMGASTFLALIFLQRVKHFKAPEGKRKRFWKKCFWYISVARNALVVIISTTIAFIRSDVPFNLTGDVPRGFPPVNVPPLTLPTRYINQTDIYEEAQGFWDTWEEYGSGPIAAAVIAILQNVAISKAFGNGQSIEATQEMFALGITNICGSFFSALPSGGSFSRSAVNEASGVRTTMGGLFTASIVLIAVAFLTPYFYYIPRASLAAVIISAVLSMIEYKTILPMWKISRLDVFICAVTFIGSIFLGMEYGIVIGVVISVAALLSQSVRTPMGPEIQLDAESGQTYILLKPETAIKFPSMDHLRAQVYKAMRRYTRLRFIVIDMERWPRGDYTAITSLKVLINNTRKLGIYLIFHHAGLHWSNALSAAGLKDPPCSNDPHRLSELLSRF